MSINDNNRARALSNNAQHGAARPSTGKKKASPAAAKRLDQTFTLKTKRDEWVRDAYKRGSPAFIERQTLVK